MKLHWIVLIAVLILCAPIIDAAEGRYDFHNTDIKAKTVAITCNPDGPGDVLDALQTSLIKTGSSETTQFVPITEKALKQQAEQIAEQFGWEGTGLGAIIDLAVLEETEPGNSILIDVYHYPFGKIASEHVNSPEYCFKFASDSALLAIAMHGAQTTEINVNLQPAKQTNPYLPKALQQKRINIRISPDLLASSKKVNELASWIRAGIEKFMDDRTYSVMGVLPDKALRHAKLENIEVQVYPYLYPDKEFSDEEKKQRAESMDNVVQAVHAFPSGLYYLTNLDRITPYSIKFIDPSKDKEHFWYDLESGSFLTSSISGIVRTVPVMTDRYPALKHNTLEEDLKKPETDQLDYVIEHVTVFEGSKNKRRYVADVGIAGERIAAIGKLKRKDRTTTIDGRGLFLMPGFIDIHSHADFNILSVTYAPSHLRQGITTVLGGNCSSSPLAIGDFLTEIDKQGAAVNLCQLIGNRPVRSTVLGRTKGMFPYSALYREKELVDLAMEEGAFGMSTGLIYTTSEEAFAWELAEMAKQMKPYGGFYASHVRGESDEVLDAIREAIYIGEIGEVPVQISHIKVINKRNWGDMQRYMDIMKAARARGLDVTGDQYPWRASGPAAHYTLYRLLVREAIKAESPEVILLKDMPGKYAPYSGRPLTDLLNEMKMTPEELIEDLDLNRRSKIYATYLCLGENDVELPMKEDFVMVCTDSSLASLQGIESGKHWDDHPRKFRSYPEFFSKYVRDKNVCSWELGVYKCSGLPAERMKIKDRGRIVEGAYADLVLLDPERLDPGVDYRDQTPPPKGIEWVFLNGEPVVQEAGLTFKRAGKAIRAYGNGKP